VYYDCAVGSAVDVELNGFRPDIEGALE